MKVLNLYACLGGNRLLWENCEVTAVELDPELARMYQERFPKDKVIVADAHEYLLKNYRDFDFIWSSPPCPTHSRARYWAAKGGIHEVVYPDMKLWQEIIFMKTHLDCKWIVENVVPYYTPLIKESAKIGRHLFWSNFVLPSYQEENANIHTGTLKDFEKFHKVEISSYKGNQDKKKIGRNLVFYETGKKLFDLAKGIVASNNINQQSLF